MIVQNHETYRNIILWCKKNIGPMDQNWKPTGRMWDPIENRVCLGIDVFDEKIQSMMYLKFSPDIKSPPAHLVKLIANEPEDLRAIFDRMPIEVWDELSGVLSDKNAGKYLHLIKLVTDAYFKNGYK
jgi:hypothetical protein